MPTTAQRGKVSPVAKLPRTFTADDAAPRWTSADMGEAMLDAVRQRANKVSKRNKKGDVDCNAWWRGGDDLSVRIFVSTGSAHDLVEGKTYNAKDFARIALGMTLPEMMDSYRLSSPSPIMAAHGIEPDAERPAPGVVATAWAALEARQVDDNTARRWMQGRGIPPALVRSGFAILDAAAVVDLAEAAAALWLRRYAVAAVVAPLRSARTGKVSSLQARAFQPTDDDVKNKRTRMAVGRLSDDDETPRTFGHPELARTGRMVLLVEGMADTWAAEALTAGVDGVVVVGAVGAGVIPKVAGWLASGKARRVVVVRHLDRIDGDGVGQSNADAAVRALDPRASHFRWPDFLRALRALGADAAPHIKDGFDLADACRIASHLDFDDVAGAFLTVIRDGIGRAAADESWRGVDPGDTVAELWGKL